MDKFEPPLKTISVWLNVPVSTGENAVKAIKVQVRIFKAGGANRGFQNNKVRKCARCMRYKDQDKFGELKIDGLVEV